MINHFHHSSFLSGGAVIGAGEIITDETGKLLRITNKSGHYKPEAPQMLDVLNELDRSGVDLSGVEIKILQGIGKSSLVYSDAANFLASQGKCLPSTISCPVEEEESFFLRELEGFAKSGMDLSKVDVSIAPAMGSHDPMVMNAQQFIDSKKPS